MGSPYKTGTILISTKVDDEFDLESFQEFVRTLANLVEHSPYDVRYEFGEVEPKPELPKMQRGLETSLDELVGQIMFYHQCTEEVAIRMIQDKISTSSS